MDVVFTIVMIEDDSGHAKLIERNMRRAGIYNQIVHFADGSSTPIYVGRVSNGVFRIHYLLLLIDLNLPDISGIDLLETVKKDSFFRQTPIIIFTSADDQISGAAMSLAAACISPSLLNKNNSPMRFVS